VTLTELNALETDAAMRELLRCCGSRRWAAAMTAARPFATLDALTGAADAIWASLDRSDWLEAFASHPRIGAGGAGRLRADGASASLAEARLDSERAEAGGDDAWLAAEQAGVASASSDVLARLAEANHEYEARFGHIFIVCATGKSADDMLHLLEQRLDHDPLIELRVAAEEQRKITRIRLEKLLDATGAITTHVLDTARGCPAAGMEVVLETRQGGMWREIGRGTTDANGRLATLTQGQPMIAGAYRLTYDTGRYQRAHGIGDPFFPDVTVAFTVGDAPGHYHVPLLLSPFGYSTYRGT
jgi:hydroxyisourate hydrolase